MDDVKVAEDTPKPAYGYSKVNRPDLKQVMLSLKTLVGQRLKRSGMSWQHNGGQGIVTLRRLIKISRFDKAWPFIEKHYKQMVTEHKNVIYLSVQNVS